MDIDELLYSVLDCLISFKFSLPYFTVGMCKKRARAEAMELIWILEFG